MEVQIPSRLMAAALRRIAYPVEKPRGRPSVAVHLEARGTGLGVSTSDGEVFASEHLECVVRSEGRVVCNFSVLRRLMEAAENSEAALTVDARTTQLQVELEHAGVQLPVLPWEHERRPTVSGATSHLDPLTCALVRRVLSAASSDPGRPALCGVHFDGDGFAATDGHRLSVVDHDFELPPSTVPGDLLAALLASFPDGCDLAADRTAATFTGSGRAWLVPLVAVPFPTYRHLIPESDSTSGVDVSAMGAALDRVTAVVGSLRLSILQRPRQATSRSRLKRPVADEFTRSLRSRGPGAARQHFTWATWPTDFAPWIRRRSWRPLRALGRSS